MIVNLTFYQNFNFPATHVAGTVKMLIFFASSVESSRCATSSHSILKAKRKIKQIDGLTKS